MHEVVIEQLVVYPVKSLSGISVSESALDAAGLKGDRQWAVFKTDNHCLTQRQNPRMVLITPQFTKEGLNLSADGFGEILVKTPNPDDATLSFTVWKDTCYGNLADDNTNHWLSEVLQEKNALQLAKITPSQVREFQQPERFSVQGPYFSDAAPYLIANTASLEALNERLTEQSLQNIDMRHFRANIIISGSPAFSEQGHSSLSSLDKTLQLQLVDYCQRCSMITVDPDRGVFLPKALPFKILSQLNSMPDNAKAPAFGVNSTLTQNTNGIDLRVGQKLRLC